MKWYNNIKIRSKLLASFLLVAFLTGFIGYMGINSMKQMSEADNKMYDKIAVPLSDLTDLVKSFLQIRGNVNRAALSDNVSEQNNYFRQIFVKKLFFLFVYINSQIT